MTRLIFLDTNVQVYAAGKDHVLKEPCAQIVSLVADHASSFVTDAEVLQELLHRYTAIRAWEAIGKDSFESFADLMQDRVEPVYAEDIVCAAELVPVHPRMEARDLLHLAVMTRLGVTRIVSADRGFDQVAGVERLDPADVDSWRESVVVT
jgi:predicted nucleic acid-binding protein